MIADLEIAQVTNSPNVVAGGIATFVVTVTNKGPGPVQGCNIINLLPAGLTYAPTPITSLSTNSAKLPQVSGFASSLSASALVDAGAAVNKEA